MACRLVGGCFGLALPSLATRGEVGAQACHSRKKCVIWMEVEKRQNNDFLCGDEGRAEMVGSMNDLLAYRRSEIDSRIEFGSRYNDHINFSIFVLTRASLW